MTDRAERNALEILNCTKQDIIDISVENLNNDCDVESFPAKEKQYKGKLQHLIEPEIQDVGTGYIKFQFGNTSSKRKKTLTIVSAHLK